MTAIPTDRIVCPARKKTTHAPTLITGHCAPDSPTHDHCPGQITNGCGCVILCACQDPNHRHPHAYEETPVLPSPFTVPDPKAAEHPEALVTPPLLVAPGDPRNAVAEAALDATQATLPETVQDWRDTVTWKDAARARPWVDGTGEPGTLEVMVRAFAMAAGDLLLSDDGPGDYDETAILAMLGILRASMRQAGKLDALLVDHLHDHGTWGERIVEGIGQVRTYRRPKNTKWDERGTAYAVLAAKMEEVGGEVPDPGVVIDWLLEAAAVDYYRVTVLRALGIDVSEYRHQEKGTRAVDVPVPD